MEPNIIGVLLHLIIPSPLLACFILCSIPVLLPNIDSTNFIFRKASFISPIYILICRILLIFFATLHGSILIFSCVINGTNVALVLHSCLSVMSSNPRTMEELTPTKLWGTNNVANSNLGSLSPILVQKTSFFLENFMNYRQLQVMMTVINQVAFEVVQVAILVMLLCCISMGYIVVKLTGKVPFPITIFAIVTLILFIGLIHLLMPLLVEVTEKTLNFVRYWQLQNTSGRRKRQLRSCRALAVWIGPFLRVTREIRIQFFSSALYHTVSLIILV